MKKNIVRAVCICLAALFLTVSCEKTEPEAAAEDVGVTRLVTTEYPAEVVYTPHLEGSYAPEISVITSRNELIQYISLYEKCYDFEDETTTMCLYDVVTNYDEAYFWDSGLVVVTLTAESPSVRYTSEGIGRSENGYDIRIRTTTPVGAIPGETDWHIFLEVPDSASFLRDPDALRLRLVESKNY